MLQICDVSKHKHTAVGTQFGQFVANTIRDTTRTINHRNTNHTHNFGYNWDSWLQTCFGTKFTQQITATGITHNHGVKY